MQKRVTLEFELLFIKMAVLRHPEPTAGLLEKLRSVFELVEIRTDMTVCDFVITDERLTKNMIIEKLYEAMWDFFSHNPDKGLNKLTIEDCDGVPEELKKENIYSQIKDSIQKLVGAEEYKALMQEIENVAEGCKANKLCSVLTSRAYLFSINDGEGLTTYATLMAKLLNQLGLTAFENDNEVRECRLRPPGQKADENDAISDVARSFSRSGDKNGKLVVIDMSEWMTKVDDKAFRNLLDFINENRGANVYVFRIPFVEREIMEKIKTAINDVITVKDVSFIPFDNDELTEIGRIALDKYGFDAEEDVWELFSGFVNSEKCDGRFYGAKTVEKIIREMLYCKQLHNSENGITDKTVRKEELAKMGTVSEDERDAFLCFDDMIGMEEIKKRVMEITQQIKEALRNRDVETPCIHMRFVGNPGTGKTTVARLLGKILRQNGVLRNGHFFECHGRSLCGRYVGETSPKTSAICRDAYGSVLFIDEAYTLYRGGESVRGDFGQEAIDTLIAEMENHRADLVVIMAGYTEEMSELMQANNGLESRMPFVIEFPNYTREQLFSIYMELVRKHYEYNSAFEQEVKSFFDGLPDELLSSKDFSNARFVRNLFERTWGKAVMRASMSKQPCNALTKEDFLMATAEKEFKNMMVKKEKRKIGFA